MLTIQEALERVDDKRPGDVEAILQALAEADYAADDLAGETFAAADASIVPGGTLTERQWCVLRAAQANAPASVGLSAAQPMAAMPESPQSKRNLANELRLLTKTPPKDRTLAYFEAVMATQECPPSYNSLTSELRLLRKPLPLTPASLKIIPQTPQAEDQLPCLVISTVHYPAASLAEYVGQALHYGVSGDGEHMVNIATHLLVTGFMKAVLGFLGINCDPYENSLEPSSAVAAAKRPDAQLFLQSVLMFKGEAKVVSWMFEDAQTELTQKLVNWSPAQGSQEYMVCCAAAGHRLRFYAVTHGGHSMKAISPEFDLRLDLDRLKVMHTTVYALTIVLQQEHHQLRSNPSPFGTREERKHSVIYYQGEYIEKQVDVRQFGQGDKDTLLQVYMVLLMLPSGANITHPPGLVRPLGMPMLVGERWEIRVPAGRPNWPTSLPDLRCIFKDILQGLSMLHNVRVVHRDIHWDNIIEMPATQMSPARYVLIDFEHSGQADCIPRFQPLLHWAPECQQPNAPYTTAADIYSVGILMAKCPLELDSLASDLWQHLTAYNPAQRPSASEALNHPWLTGAS
ncbi:probable crinkler effector protein 8 at C-terminar half [Coccomyxa sp. Obi]|nr:probable crinkler effector protein 8 at C-terminar half [Coccomyxa sp. Obi]